MSTTIDQQVVEMRFDNKHFENNVSTTMSTLDKLKEKLNFSGASKGLEGVNAAAKNVNMAGLGSAVESVSMKFSALQVMGVTALANITNSAVNAGKRIVSALTIDPVKTGFQEYETQINAVQTILANTQSKGTTINDVNAALEALNKYADMTIYNFTEMTRNIGTFTAAGVDLETSVNAIQGIANLAAISGSTSQQASTAMYQLSQALSSGTVKLMDWNSVVNAGMGGQVFQDALKETARVHGVAIDKMIEEQGSFRETLSEGWLTSEILTETLQKFTLTTEGLTEEQIKANREMLKAKGYTEDQIDEIFKLGAMATDAATKVKTFTQLWDVLKEAAQSGWSQTWKIIIGDFEQAKNFLTPLADTLTGFINKTSDWRNNILKGAFGSSWDRLISKINEAGIETESFEEKIKSALTSAGYDVPDLLKKYGSLEKIFQNVSGAAEVVLKTFKDGFTVTNKSESKYDFSSIDRVLGWYTVGDDVKIVQAALEELGHKLPRFGVDGIIGPETTAAIKAFQEVAKVSEDGVVGPETIAALEKALTTTGKIVEMNGELDESYDELILDLKKISGRDLFIGSLKNVGDAISGIVKTISNAWVKIFNPPGVDVLADKLYDALVAFNKFSEKLRFTDAETGELNDTAKKLQRTFEGVFAIVDIVATILGGGLRIAFKVLTSILSYFNLDILDVTANIGDAIVAFHDWFESTFSIAWVLDKVTPLVEKAAIAISNWFNAFKDSSGMQKAIDYIKEIGIDIRDWWAGLKDAEDLPKTIAEGIVNAFSNIPTVISTVFSHIKDAFIDSFSGIENSFVGKIVGKIRYGLQIAGQTIVELGKILLEKVNGVLTANGFAEISKDSIAGLIAGFKAGAVEVWNAAVAMAAELVQKVKDYLGIQSPSTVFMAIGGFIIAGLIAGLQNGIPDSLDAIKDVFQPMLDWIKGIDLGAVLAAVIGIGTVSATHKTLGILEALVSPIEGLGELFEGTGKVLKKSARPIAKVINNTAKVVKSFSKVLNSVAFSIKVDAIKKLGETLLLLVGAIVVLSFIKPAKLWNAVGVIAALAVILGVLAWATGAMNSASAAIDKEGINLQGLSTGLIQIGAAILLLGITVKMLGSLEPEQAKQGFIGLVGLLGAIALVFAGFALLNKLGASVNMGAFGGMIMQVAVAFLVMSAAVKMFGGMDSATLEQGTSAIVGFSIVIMGLMAATKLISGSKNVDTIGATLLKIALAIGVMALVARLVGDMDRDELIQGGIAIAAFGGIIAGLMAATKLITGSKNIDTIGGALLKVALAIGVMALVVKMLGGMDTGALIRGGIAVVAFGGIIVGLMAATKLISGSKNIERIGAAILGISGAIAIMAFTAFMLSMISWEGFAKGTIMITAFAGIVVALMAATKWVSGSKNVEKIGATLISVAGAIGIIALIAVLLSLVPEENLKKGLAIVTALSLLMAGLIFVTKFSKNCMSTVIAMAGAIAVIGGVIYLLSTIPTQSAIGSAVALGGLLVVMTASLAALSFIGKFAKDAFKGVIALAAMAIPLLAFVGVLALMQNVQNAMANVKALSVLAATISLLLVPLTLVGVMGAQALIGVLALTAMAIPLLAFVGILALMSGVQNGIANAKALADLMTTIGDLLVKISIVAPLAVIGVGALSALVGLMIALGVVATAIGALVTEFPQLQTFINTGIPILEKLAHGLGSVIANFITGFAGEVMTLLPQLGQCLSQFMMNLMPFITGAKLIDEKVLVGIGILTAAILAFSVAELISGIASLTGLSLAALGLQLSAFMIAALPFIQYANLIDPSALTGIKTLAEAILILTAANVIEGLTSLFGGGSSLENFATQLPVLGKGLAEFSNSLGTFTEDQLNTVKCAAQAVKTLAQASSEIPNTGGLLAQIVGDNDLGTFAAQFPTLGTGLAQFLTNVGTFTDEQVATVNCAAQAIKVLAQASSEIPNAGGLLGQLVGENDLATFASQFPVLGSGLRGFLDNVGTFTDEQVSTVNCAAQAIKALAQASSDIPNTGGLLAQIVGENDLATFSEQFPALGTALSSFLTNAGTFTEEQLGTITCAASAVKALAEAASEIPNEGGWISKLVGDNDLGTFAENFPKVGTGLAGFVGELGTFSESKVATVQSAVAAINALSKLADSDLKGATKHLSDFGEDLVDFGTDLDSFCFEIPSASTVTSAIDSLNKILAAVKSIGDANSGVLSTFAENLKEVGTEAVEKFVEAFTSDSAKTDLEDAAEELCDEVIDGIESKEKNVKTAGTDVAKKAVAGVKTQKDDMESAGKDLGKGLIKGINSMKTAVYNAGYALGQQAVKGEKAGQKSASPSKLTIQAGKWLGEGLIIGMDQMGRSVYKAGENLGKSATDTLSSTISRVSDMISTDIDAQPTIRPVLDLSDVRSGASAISGMFNFGPSVGVMANVGTINSMMNRRNQNGVNSEVVSAIDKLRGEIGSLERNVYHIDGITYDDGSNIANAVKTITRVARMERRV